MLLRRPSVAAAFIKLLSSLNNTGRSILRANFGQPAKSSSPRSSVSSDATTRPVNKFVHLPVSPPKISFSGRGSANSAKGADEEFFHSP